MLVVADFHARDALTGAWTRATYRSYDFRNPPDPLHELATSLDGALVELGATGAAAVAVESLHLPAAVAAQLERARYRSSRRRGAHDGNARPSRRSVAVVAASHLADIAQRVVKAEARPGITELELAGLAATAMDVHAGQRLSAILTVSTGAEGTGGGGGVATGRAVKAGDLVLTDVAPWIGGGWSDTANTVSVGPPDARTRKRFDRSSAHCTPASSCACPERFHAM